MIDRIGTSQIQDLLTGVSQNSRNAAAKTGNADASLQADYATLIAQATAIQDDAQAIEQAKTLLETGQLDNPEIIRQTAANIIEQGI